MDLDEDTGKLNNPLGLGLMELDQSIRGNIVMLDDTANPIMSNNDSVKHVHFEHSSKPLDDDLDQPMTNSNKWQQTSNNWNFTETGTFQISSKTYGSKFYIKNGITAIQSAHHSSASSNKQHTDQIISPQNQTNLLTASIEENKIETPQNSARGTLNTSENHIFTSMDDIEIEATLGSGISGTVKKAIHLPTKTQLALKYIDFSDKHKRKQFVDEMMLFLKFNHPCIVKFHGCCVDNTNYNGNVILGLEFMNYGSLAGFVKHHLQHQSFKFNTAQCKKLSGDITSALAYLEFNKVCHRDIKPENILVNYDEKANEITFKLADFGLTKCMESTVGFAKTQIGTLLYMSPERMLGKPYNWKSDVWSFGLVLIYCMNGAQSPYKQISTQGPLAVHMAIVEEDPPQIPQRDGSGQTYSMNLHSFVQACLYKDPQKRWNASDLLMHPFLLE